MAAHSATAHDGEPSAPTSAALGEAEDMGAVQLFQYSVAGLSVAGIRLGDIESFRLIPGGATLTYRRCITTKDGITRCHSPSAAASSA